MTGAADDDDVAPGPDSAQQAGQPGSSLGGPDLASDQPRGTPALFGDDDGRASAPTEEDRGEAAAPDRSTGDTPHQPVNKGPLSEQEALAGYLAMGPKRSLRGLLKSLRVEGFNPPHLSTLKDWSTEHDWAVKARAHDAEVADHVRQRIVKEQTEEQYDAVKFLRRFAVVALSRASELSQTEEDQDRLIGNAIRALQQGEVMIGGVSDRREQRDETTIRDERADAKRRDLRRRYGLEDDASSGEAAKADPASGPRILQ